MSNTIRRITGEELDRKFDTGEDILDYVDVEHHPPLQRRVTLTMPSWMVEQLDDAASNMAISRNAVVNTWLAERMQADRKVRQTV